MSDALHDRGRALEEKFFADRDAERVKALRAKSEHNEAVHELHGITGIDDTAVLDHLVDLGVTADSLAAFMLVPVVHVAWVDRHLDEAERTTLLQEAHEAGVAKGTVSYDLLQGWLNRQPPADLFAAWKDYWAALSPRLADHQRKQFANTVLPVARRVARASGGFIGIGSVGEDERKALEELEALLG